jgi:hypothetical protein
MLEFLFRLFFDPEDGSDMFQWNVGLSQSYALLNLEWYIYTFK